MFLRVLGLASGLGLALATALARADLIETAAGERVTGRILRISEGTVRLQHQLSGELELSVDRLTHLSTDGPMTAQLLNGDRVIGRLEMTGPEAVVVRSGSFGDVRLSLTVIASIVPAETSLGGEPTAEAPPAPAAAVSFPRPAARPADPAALAAERRRSDPVVAQRRRAPSPAVADHRPLPAPATNPEAHPAAAAPTSAASRTEPSPPLPPAQNQAMAADWESTVRGRNTVAQAPPNGTTAPPSDNQPPGEQPPSEQPPSEQQRPAEMPETREAPELGFLRREAVLLRPGAVELDLSVGYLRNRGPIENDQAVITTGTVRASFLPGLETFVSLPFSWSRRELVGANITGFEQSGIGDVRAGLKYTLVNQSINWPTIVANASFGAPTGKPPYLPPSPQPGVQVLDIRNPLNVPLGSGHWALSAGFSMFKSFDPIIVFGGFDFTRLLPATFYGVEIAPGDRYDFNLGFGFGVSEYSTLSAQLLSDYQTSWTFNGVKAPQPSGATMSLRLAYTHRASNYDLVEPSIVFGLTEEATDAVFTLAYTHLF